MTSPKSRLVMPRADSSLLAALAGSISWVRMAANAVPAFSPLMPALARADNAATVPSRSMPAVLAMPPAMDSATAKALALVVETFAPLASTSAMRPA